MLAPFFIASQKAIKITGIRVLIRRKDVCREPFKDVSAILWQLCNDKDEKIVAGALTLSLNGC